MPNTHVPGLSPTQPVGEVTPGGMTVTPNQRFAEQFNRLLRKVEALETERDDLKQRVEALEES